MRRHSPRLVSELAVAELLWNQGGSLEEPEGSCRRLSLGSASDDVLNGVHLRSSASLRDAALSASLPKASALGAIIRVQLSGMHRHI
jgi:hypothetical protein